MSVPDAAYLAGLIDGEGSVMLVRRQNGGAHLRLTIANTDRAILEWTAEATGVGGVYLQRKATERTKASYSWRAHGDGAASVIRQVRPYLRIKPVQADLGLTHHEALRIPARKADLSWQRENLAAMKLMNRRGGSS